MTITLVRGERRVQGDLALAPFHHWLSPAGGVWAEFFRVPNGYLVRSTGVADFVIAADGLACEAWPVPDASDETVEHVFRNMVCPLARSQQCEWMLHAGAVEVEGGCVLFVGPAGRGKSTLTAHFAVSGDRFLADDAVQVVFDRDQPAIAPGAASIRLWSDSHRELIEAGTPASTTQLNDKACFAAGGRMIHCTDLRPLRRVYFLDDGGGEEIRIERVPAAEALIGLVKSSFVLDVEAHHILEAHFDTMARLAGLPLFYTLSYPRRFDRLADVRQAIRAHCSGIE
jgi:hypothetical protein